MCIPQTASIPGMPAAASDAAASLHGHEANFNTTNRKCMMSDHRFTMPIGGKAVAGSATYTVINPADGLVIASAPDCLREKLEQAVTAARAAFAEWAARPISERRGLARNGGRD
jgi:delta 1-pyrroline-5-carboxylate dehydrogenase